MSGDRAVRLGSTILGVASVGMLAATFAILAGRPDVSTATGRQLWAGALAIATVALEEMFLAFIPLRHGQRWALWAASAPFAVLGIPILLIDAFNVPGRHLFGTLLPQVSGLAMGAVGLALCARGILARRTA